MLNIILFILCAFIIYHHLIYPIILKSHKAKALSPASNSSDVLPTISIIVPAFNEEKYIADKLINFLLEIYKIKKNEILSSKLYGEIIDRLNNLPFLDYTYGHKKFNISEINKEIDAINELCKEERIKICELPNINKAYFVKNSFMFEGEIIKSQEYEGYNHCINSWGELL